MFLLLLARKWLSLLLTYLMCLVKDPVSLKKYKGGLAGNKVLFSTKALDYQNCALLCSKIVLFKRVWKHQKVRFYLRYGICGGPEKGTI